MPAALAPFVFLVPGTVSLLVATFHLARTLRAQRWPSIGGVVVEARTLERPSDVRRVGIQFDDFVRYRYTVAGRPYLNDRLAFGPAPKPRALDPRNEPRLAWGVAALAAAEARTARAFAPGRDVTVYYNPANPADSTLHVAPTRAVYVALVGGGALITFGAILPALVR